jgi:hypothetical protein
VEDLTFQRSGSSVKLYKPYGVPSRYWVRAGATKSSKVNINSLSGANQAKLLVRTWNGREGGAGSGSDSNPLKVNSWNGKIGGRDHQYAFTSPSVPLSALKTGENTISFHSTTDHHGIEVLWPGPAIIIKYS